MLLDGCCAKKSLRLPLGNPGSAPKLCTTAFISICATSLHATHQCQAHTTVLLPREYMKLTYWQSFGTAAHPAQYSNILSKQAGKTTCPETSLVRSLIDTLSDVASIAWGQIRRHKHSVGCSPLPGPGQLPAAHCSSAPARPAHSAQRLRHSCR